MVADKGLWCGKQIYIAVYAAHVPHILSFKIRGIAPTDDLNADIVLALACMLCNIKFRIVVSALCVAHVFTVHPYKGCSIDTVEMEEKTLVDPVCRQVKVTAVRCNGIQQTTLHFNHRRIVVERIFHIYIQRVAIAVHLKA